MILGPLGMPYAGAASSRGTTSNQEPPPPNFLGLVSCDLEELADECRRRVGCGSTELEYYRVPGELVRAKENTTKIRALILGPPFAPHEGSASMRGNEPKQPLPPPNVSNLVSYENEQPTDNCQRRVGRGIKEVEFYRVARVFVGSDENNTAKIHAFILGPAGTPYEGGASAPGTMPNQQLPPPSSWYLVSSEDEGPAVECRRGVGCAVKVNEFYRVPEMFISVAEMTTAKIDKLMLGPPGTPYEGGFFQLLLKCPPEYSNSAPRFGLTAADAGCVRFLPTLCENDEVCQGLLSASCGPACSAGQCMGSVLCSVKSVLTPESSVVLGCILICYNAVLQHKNIRVPGVRHGVPCLGRISACPLPLREVILKHFRQLRRAQESGRGTHAP
ncbi:hypothetical protein HPB50_027998 [Hyalomma asiaticum]|nr:hypothetical protein HPB50_027998 [Hyalomma asiaticum]